jgi:hypothetical protein
MEKPSRKDRQSFDKPLCLGVTYYPFTIFIDSLKKFFEVKFA